MGRAHLDTEDEARASLFIFCHCIFSQTAFHFQCCKCLQSICPFISKTSSQMVSKYTAILKQFKCKACQLKSAGLGQMEVERRVPVPEVGWGEQETGKKWGDTSSQVVKAIDKTWALDSKSRNISWALPPTLLGLHQTLVIRKSRALLCFNSLEHHKHPHADWSKGTSHPALLRGRNADGRALLYTSSATSAPEPANRNVLCPSGTDTGEMKTLLATYLVLRNIYHNSHVETKGFFTLMPVLPSAHCPRSAREWKSDTCSCLSTPVGLGDAEPTKFTMEWV